MLVFGACNDTADPLVEARVRSIDAPEVCLDVVDENFDYADGCYVIKDEDAVGLAAGSCIASRLPNPLDRERRDEPIDELRLLDENECT
jgi:hypothetical protein